MDWFRWWHGTVTDPKFQWVSRRSGQPLTTVIAVWACLLECASNATQCNADATRGDVASFDCNDFDVLLGLEDGRVQKVWDAMVEKNLIVDGRISGWENRQPKREDSGNPSTGALSSTERSRLHRERKKHDETQGDDMKRNATQCNDREDKSREEKKEPKSKAEASATRLPADWEPSEGDVAFCRDERPDLMPAQVASQFRDYWVAQPGAKGRKLDWPATWRNWVRNQRATTGPRQVHSYHDERAETIAALTGRNRHHHEHDERTIDAPAFQLLAG